MSLRSRAAWIAFGLCAGCSGAVSGSPAPAPPPEPARAPAAAKAEPPPAALPAALAKTPGDPAAIEKPPPAVDKRPRMGSIGQYSYIYKHPEPTGLALGYIRIGTSVPLKSDKPVPGKGCGRGWYAVEPRGYACLDPKTTLDLNDPYFKALQSVAPDADAAWYYRYAYSNGAPMDSRVPTREEIDKEDQRFGPRGAFKQLGEWAKGHEELLTPDPIAATDPIPDFFAGGKRHVASGTRNPTKLIWRVIPNGSIVAYARAFEANGRTWLLTPDLMLVPADRVRAMRRSKFHGVKLGDGLDLPLAWNRTRGTKPKYKKQNGKLVAVPDAIAAKTFVPVSEDEITDGGKSYLPIRGEPDTFVLEDDVTVSRARNTLPKGVQPGEKWIEAKILPGTLTAYEGDKPVFATLFSPGKGGAPVPGHDNTKYATTATGFFPIEWKDRVATMSSEKHEPRIMWFTDVPHVQYLRAPLAMHVAVWHEDFGNPKSAECVNISPEDGRFLFNWTEPGLPEGWGAMRPGDGNGRSTAVVITAR